MYEAAIATHLHVLQGVGKVTVIFSVSIYFIITSKLNLTKDPPPQFTHSEGVTPMDSVNSF